MHKPTHIIYCYTHTAAAGGLTNLTHTAANDTLLSGYNYELDNLGNRVQATETLTGTTRTITYTYDFLNRLTEADYSTGERYEYAYDEVGNRTAMTATRGVAGTADVTLYEYDSANRLTSVDGVTYTWDNRGNLIDDGTFTYTYNTAGRMVACLGTNRLAESVTVTLVYTYNAAGLRVAQSVIGFGEPAGDVTSFAWDWASGLPEMLSEGQAMGSSIALYLVGHETLGQWDGVTWTYYMPDALGSIRQTTDEAGSVTDSREWTPFGVEVGTAQGGLGYTGEWWDDSAGFLYLRARWYDGEAGRFTSRDIWQGYLEYPLSQNAWLYVYANPLKFVDPSGYDADCPIGRWDCEAVRNIKLLKQAFLNSASRHNRIPTMDNNGFAALIAASIVSERRIGNIPSDEARKMQQREDWVMAWGCTVSGRYVKDAWDQRDYSRLMRYMTNQEVPQRATVGIGNVWLETAANLWKGQACSSLGDCTPVQVSTLQTTNALGWTVDINNPFGPQVFCGPGGTCGPVEPSEIESYQMLGQQLLNNEMNIEYVAANMEAGAMRATALGLQPSAFNSAAWHIRGLQTNNEIERARWNPGGAIYILDDIPTALTVLGVTSSWNLSTEDQYVYWTTHPAP